MHKQKISLRGVYPPIPTPFDQQGEVTYQALTDNVRRWNQYGLGGYVVLGSNGEAPYLTPEERRRVLETARAAIPSDKVLIAGTGAESTRQTIALTRQAAQVGADVALVVTPNYFDPLMRPDNLIHHYQLVADASPIPVLMYTVPQFTHIDLEAETIAQVAEHPNVVGVKDSSGNLIKLGATVGATRSDFQVLAGSGAFFLAALVLGAVGCVPALGNIAPQQCVKILSLFLAGKLEEAAELQRRMIPINQAVTARHGIAGLKAALDMLGYYGGPARSPLLGLSETDYEAVRAALMAGGLLPGSGS